ncbi:unnamed protein product, partial [Mesorhabditis belari]|uniref:Uncharacterized protein n=1 Tax=Mesorhabditis belari TaxID=2138241 RepID=A0AAF3FQJ9_9BILA
MLDEVKAAGKDVAKPTKGDQTAKIPGPSQADGNVLIFYLHYSRLFRSSPRWSATTHRRHEDLRLRTDVLNQHLWRQLTVNSLLC